MQRPRPSSITSSGRTSDGPARLPLQWLQWLRLLMRRGDLYRVRRPGGDPKRSRVFVVVSRQVLIESTFSTVICAPVFTEGQGLTTQVAVGMGEGVKHDSVILCDNLVSIAKADLTDYIGTLAPPGLAAVNRALRIALEL